MEQDPNRSCQICLKVFSSKFSLNYRNIVDKHNKDIRLKLSRFEKNFKMLYSFRYNSGGKKFTKIHTKSLTVTIDAFTIHNALWLGKKAKLPDKRDMALVV